MRVVTVLLASALMACQQKPRELTFEGAGAKETSAIVAHGKRLADVLDCTGCHGLDLQGTNLRADMPKMPANYAPNITLLQDEYSDAELDRLIRHGVPRDGREFWFIPVESYQFLSGADMAALVTFLRTVKPAGKQLPSFRVDEELKKEIAEGLIGNAQEQIRKYRNKPPPDLGQKHAWGRYLVQTTCTVCHNSALEGWEHFTPDLDIAGTYTTAELETLLRTGKGKSRPDLGMMSEMGRKVFPRLTPRERAAVIAYVKARADRPRPVGAD
jgi:mono/diheme cytochrome c family protein